MSRLKKWTIRGIIIVAAFTIIGFFILPPILKSILIKTLSENLHREVAIHQLRINPYTLSLTVRGFTIKDRKSPEIFLSFDELFINLQSLSALKRALIVKEVSVKQPYIKVIRHQDLTYNFADLMEKKEPKEPKEGEKGKPLKFSINNIKIVNGSIDFWDEPKQKKHIIKEMNINLPFLSNTPYYVDTYVEPTLSLKVNDTPYALQGRTKPFSDSLETIFDVQINDLDIPSYLTYLPLKINAKMTSGYLDVKAKISFVQQKDRDPAIILSGDFSLKKLNIDDDRNRSLLRFPLLHLSGVSVQPLSKIIQLSKITLQSPEIFLQRDQEGIINIQKVVPETQKTKPPEGQGGKPSPLSIDIGEAQIEGGKISFYDLSVGKSPETGSGLADIKEKEDRISSRHITLIAEKFNLKLENISNEKNKKGQLSLSLILNKKGTILSTGSIGLEPLFANLKLDLKKIAIRPFQSYFTEKVKINIMGGDLAGAGNLALNHSSDKGLHMTFTGKASLSNFSSIDKLNAEDFLKWESLSFSDLNVGHNPLLVDIKRISLTNFYTRVIINANGMLNLQEIIEKGEPKQETIQSPVTPEKTPPPTQEKALPSPKENESTKNIKIGTVTLGGGTIDFSDRSVKPDYSAKLTEIVGKISGLSSEETTLADVDLRGKLDDYAPLEITGKINPLKEDLYVDIKARFKDMELSPTTPYAGKYAGYTVEKGKLSFDLKYLIVKKKLESQNYIFLDQLTLGDKVESPQATKLPVKLAIALLKNRNGEIKLDIPVTGSLDDPKFSVWGIILKILINLLSKAATSPFSLLGAVFGGGEELSFVEFDFGSTLITEPSAKKLQTISKALNDRPSLKMDIEGHVDMEKDREGLKQYLFNRKVKAQKLNEMVKKGQPPVPVDEVKIEPNEYEKYLKMAYKGEKFPKPKNVIGMTKDIPAPEMEKLMLTYIEVKESDLRTLASQRAMKVKDAILKSKQVEPERVFILEPKSLSPEKKEKVRNSRVDFKLK